MFGIRRSRLGQPTAIHADPIPDSTQTNSNESPSKNSRNSTVANIGPLDRTRLFLHRKLARSASHIPAASGQNTSTDTSRKRSSCPELPISSWEELSSCAELEESIQRIGSLFRQDTAGSMQNHDHAYEVPQDISGRVRRLPGVTAHQPMVISLTTSAQRLNGVVPDVYLSEEEDIMAEFDETEEESAVDTLHETYSSPDYLGVDIPDSNLSAPAEMYEMIWGCKLGL